MNTSRQADQRSISSSLHPSTRRSSCKDLFAKLRRRVEAPVRDSAALSQAEGIGSQLAPHEPPLTAGVCGRLHRTDAEAARRGILEGRGSVEVQAESWQTRRRVAASAR